MNSVNKIRERINKLNETLLRIEDSDDHARLNDALNESSKLIEEANSVRILCEELHKDYMDTIYKMNKDKPRANDGDAFIFWGEDRNETINFSDDDAVQVAWENKG